MAPTWGLYQKSRGNGTIRSPTVRPMLGPLQQPLPSLLARVSTRHPVSTVLTCHHRRVLSPLAPSSIDTINASPSMRFVTLGLPVSTPLVTTDVFSSPLTVYLMLGKEELRMGQHRRRARRDLPSSHSGIGTPRSRRRRASPMMPPCWAPS